MSTLPRPRREGAWTELLLRAFALTTYAVLVGNVARAWWADPSRITLLLLLASESFTLGLVLLARRAGGRDLSPIAMAATLYAAFFFVFFQYQGTQHLAPEWLGATLQLAGLGWQVASKVALGRCFGLLPASRGLVTRGPYRVVRHPIYLGYFIAHIGFLVTNFSWVNLFVLATLYLAQTVRMQREEAVLRAGEQGAQYQAYCTLVRYRLVPRVF
jgi:protein-S-isoprenylcysteine O-methyltransferase Ste14